MPTYQFPDSQELRLIEQTKIARLMAQRPIFDLFKVRTADSHVIMWEQLDNYTGLQQLRGLGGAPTKIDRTGAKRYTMTPGAYGEFSLIDEVELTARRPYGQLDGTISIADLVMMEQDRLLLRRLDRIELIGWTLLTTGTFSISAITGGVVHTDSYTSQTYSAGVSWGTAATSTPLMDFRNVKLKARGFSVRFDATAKAYMNSTTANNLYSNTNSADLFGRRTEGLGTFNSPAQINSLFMGDNLPQIVEYDEGYIDSSNTFQLFIPNNKVVVIGNRTSGAPVAEYVMTRNVNNPGMEPGAYTRVIDRGEQSIPRSIEVHDGHNGGPVMLFPSAIVLMSV